MPDQKRGAGTGLSVGGMLSAGAQIGAEPGATEADARSLHKGPLTTNDPEAKRGHGMQDPLRRGVKLSEEYTP